MSRSINSRAETMKKFKPPFHIDDWKCGVYDAENTLVTWTADESGFDLPEEHAELICDALNFYYAKKGEKE